MAVVNFRTDERAERALAELTADGSTVSDAIRPTLQRVGRCSRTWTNSVRGDIHRLRAPRGVRARRGARYAVVLQSDDLLLSTLLVAPTSRFTPPRVFRPTITIGAEQTQVLIEQTVAVAPEHLGALVGHTDRNELEEIDSALRLVLQLD